MLLLSQTFRRRFVITLRVLTALVSAAFLSLQGLSQFGYFKNPTWLPVFLAIGVAVFLFIESVTATIRAANKPEQDKVQARIHKAVVGALWEIADWCGLDLAVLGVSVFLVEKRLVWCGWKSPPRPAYAPVLTRPLRFRISDSPQASMVLWTSGKGAIGSVLNAHTSHYVHWAKIAQRWSKNPPITYAKFKTIPKATRGNFTYKEFIGILDKYAEVLAVPIMSEDGATLLGVISIDRPYVASDLTKHFDTVEVRTFAEQAATLVQRVL
ncbi:hypothetical protein [Rhodococcus erythropolis]